MNYKIDTVNSRKLIELENVTKIYQTNDGPVESLKPLSFHINEGEFVSVVGPSGCGKSTLLKLVAGLLPISGGNLKLAGKNIDGPQKNVGIVFQSAVLLAWRNVLDNILLLVLFFSVKNKYFQYCSGFPQCLFFVFFPQHVQVFLVSGGEKVKDAFVLRPRIVAQSSSSSPSPSSPLPGKEGEADGAKVKKHKL
jgi:ABC-type Fe3+/spermidine/putrescine transport system ATPase subunit